MFSPAPGRAATLAEVHQREMMGPMGPPRYGLLAISAALVACGDPTAVAGWSRIEGCLSAACHQAIEHIHYGGDRLRCVDCHGGNPDAVDKAPAHGFVGTSLDPASPVAQVLLDPSLADLDALDPATLRFVNPADYRVVRSTCGNDTLGSAGCHSSLVERTLQASHTTLLGTFSSGLCLAGFEEAPPFALLSGGDDQTPTTLEGDPVEDVRTLPGATLPAASALAEAFLPVMEQLCVDCHAGRDGPHRPGRYFSSGCSSCHMLTSDASRSESLDETVERAEPGHPLQHRFTNLVPDSQCAHCHTAHLGRSLLALGVRERSEAPVDALLAGAGQGREEREHVVPWGAENYVRFQGRYENYGKTWPFYVADEDGRNDVDETPPDVHTAAGMGCIDCHNMRELHGSGGLEPSMDFGTDVRCETCHGRPGETNELTSASGRPMRAARTTVLGSGVNTEMFEERAEGGLVQRSKLTGALHPVTQIAERGDWSSADHNPRVLMGCVLHSGTPETRLALKQLVRTVSSATPWAVPERFPGLTEGFHMAGPTDREDPGRLECFACHNTWTPNCFGCHIVRDDRETYVSRLSGETRRGRVTPFGMEVSADALMLGFNGRNRISPVVGLSVFFTHIAEDGERVIDAQPLTPCFEELGEGPAEDGPDDPAGADSDHLPSIGGEAGVMIPVHHHTVQRVPRDCDACHPASTMSHDKSALLQAWGLGTGEHVFVDGSGRTHWLDRMLTIDYDLEAAIDSPGQQSVPLQVLETEHHVRSLHPNTVGFVGPEGMQCCGPHPLMAYEIWGMITNVVLPQR